MKYRGEKLDDKPEGLTPLPFIHARDGDCGQHQRTKIPIADTRRGASFRQSASFATRFLVKVASNLRDLLPCVN